MREEFGIQVKRSKRSNQGGKKNDGNNDGDGSSDSEEYYAEMERIKEAKKRQEQLQGAKAPDKKFVPALRIGGLGLSSLVKGDGSKT